MLLDAPGRFDAVHLGHINIHHDHVGVELLSEFHRFRPVPRFANHFEMLVGGHNAPQAFAHEGMIVHKQQANRPLAPLILGTEDLDFRDRTERHAVLADHRSSPALTHFPQLSLRFSW